MPPIPCMLLDSTIFVSHEAAALEVVIAVEEEEDVGVVVWVAGVALCRESHRQVRRGCGCNTCIVCNVSFGKWFYLYMYM